MRVYVAGPYTKGDPCVNTKAAIDVGNELLDEGHEPFVPHLSHFWHTVSPRPYEDWLRLDLAFVKVCQAVIRLPGESKGADREVDTALAFGIPFFRSVPEFLAFASEADKERA